MISLFLVSVFALAPFDHSEWDQFLKQFVNEKGEVNYRGAQEDPSLLDAYLGKVGTLSSSELEGYPREERLALLINVYNAAVIRAILKHYPVSTVMQVPGFWDKPAATVGTLYQKKGEGTPMVFSLNLLESFSLRMRFRDEKILFAISKGARGSPRLRQEAYLGPKLEGQLYLAVKEFVNDPAHNAIEPEEKEVDLSRLFKWYGKDFLLNWSDFPEEVKWNPEEMAVLSFLAHYLDDPEKAEFLQEEKYKVKYRAFDWSLNDWAPEKIPPQES